MIETKKQSQQKVIIFDASTIISLSMNGLLPELRKLKKLFKGKFIIPEEVKHEILDRAIEIKRFELEALRAKQLIEQGILEFPESIGINKSEISRKTFEFLELANEIFISNKKEINIIHKGEAACLALSRILDEKGIQNLIAMDERTVRMLIEKPQNLKALLERKLHTKIMFKKDNFEKFKGFKIIRSAELIYVAYKNNLIDMKDKGRLLDALLYALKFKGCAISHEEIEEIKKQVK
jgi:predicted nucleic acid-binding protein